MSVNKLRSIVLYAAFGVALFACGSTESELATSTEPEATSEVAESDAPIEASTAIATTTTPVVAESEAPTEEPTAGEEETALLDINDECRNGGRIEAFGVIWRIIDSTPVRLTWQDQAAVEGIVRFESFENSFFEHDGAVIRVTNTLDLEEQCEHWE